MLTWFVFTLSLITLSILFEDFLESCYELDEYEIISLIIFIFVIASTVIILVSHYVS